MFGTNNIRLEMDFHKVHMASSGRPISPSLWQLILGICLAEGSSYNDGCHLSRLHQGCHNGRFWMKMSAQTSFSSGRPRTPSGRPPTSAFIRGRAHASARTHPNVCALHPLLSPRPHGRYKNKNKK
jgi:hypothetical protein